MRLIKDKLIYKNYINVGLIRPVHAKAILSLLISSCIETTPQREPH